MQGQGCLWLWAVGGVGSTGSGEDVGCSAKHWTPHAEWHVGRPGSCPGGELVRLCQVGTVLYASQAGGQTKGPWEQILGPMGGP